MSRTAWAGLAVFVIALVMRMAYVEQNERDLGLDVSRLDQTDNHVFAEWARIIARGDLLCLEQPHAFHHWTAEVAPEDKWLEWYGGGTTFHQAPLYPYAVAVVFSLAGDSHAMVARAQALLGAFACLLTFLLAARVLSLRGALFAGLLLAFMGSFYFYDAFILRDGPMAFLVALLALALQRAVETDRVPRWFLAGAALGLFTLAKETGPPLLVLTLLGLALWKRHAPALLLPRVAALLLGFLLLLSPAVARNLAVGAPAFKLSTRGPEVFVSGNAQGQTGVGWEPPIAELRRILMDANGSLSRSMLLTLATHRAEPTGYLALLWNKTRAFFSGYEVPNNVDFYLHRSHLSTLRAGFVSMTFLAPACLLGMLLCLPRRRRMAVPYLMLPTLVGSVVSLYILARFRLQVLPLMAVFAGASIDWALVTARNRRWAALILAGLLFSLLASWSWWDADPFGERNKHSGIMLKLAKIGDFGKAMRYRDLLLKTLEVAGPDAEGMDENMASKLGALTSAFQFFDRSQSEPDGSAAQLVLRGEGYSLLQEITKRGDLRDFHALAIKQFRRALMVDPEVVGAEHGIGVALSRLATHAQHDGTSPNLGPALSQFMRELALHPEHGESHRDAGHIRYLWEDYPEALQHFLLAERAGAAGGPELASIARISVDTRLASLPPVRVAALQVPICDPARGSAYGARALALSPRDPGVLDKQADVLLVERRHDEAIVLLERLMELQPWRARDLTNRIAKFREQQQNLARRDAAQQAEQAAVNGTTGGEQP